MELLTTIRNTVLEKMEQDAVNLFSTVTDLRAFICATRPAPSVIVTVKLCCLTSERLAGCCGTRVTCMNRLKCIGFDEEQGSMRALELPALNARIAKVVVWDDTKPHTVHQANMDFRPGGVYEFHRVAYVGLNDGIATGAVQYDCEDTSKVCEVSPPITRHYL
ncbi:hypothetical protein PHYPSEUDO_015609 [Phytophthora pseudosyringae]|uniref:Uncharacterized protein n=1 Tax=Phytophthora pseudosyringae TaxID=221518 RepID=A0A8T1W378_9STRA|nr:hypothetical protein PHYPSEUDO_015609 [Phytophthora pseudosyringae]